MKAKRTWMGGGLLLCLAGCQGASAPDAKQSGTALPVAADTRPDAAAPATHYARATQALAENRMLVPAGDNAVEHYLAARADAAERVRAQAALSELQPYVLIAAEQAITRGDASRVEDAGDMAGSAAAASAAAACNACSRSNAATPAPSRGSAGARPSMRSIRPSRRCASPASPRVIACSAAIST